MDRLLNPAQIRCKQNNERDVISVSSDEKPVSLQRTLKNASGFAKNGTEPALIEFRADSVQGVRIS